MIISAVDTDILLDVMVSTCASHLTSRIALRRAASEGPLIVSPVGIAEIAGNFTLRSELHEFLDALEIRVIELSDAACFLAGHFYREYKERGGNRARIVADFLIAAHAQTFADRLLTRDHRFFGGSFPALQAVHPADLQ